MQDGSWCMHLYSPGCTLAAVDGEYYYVLGGPYDLASTGPLHEISCAIDIVACKSMGRAGWKGGKGKSGFLKGS